MGFKHKKKTFEVEMFIPLHAKVNSRMSKPGQGNFWKMYNIHFQDCLANKEDAPFCQRQSEPLTAQNYIYEAGSE